jgi:hypothetical protein|tara:strand:+ start:267 stop:572 length:306 start_codon:yes stop_codon:yes gene_type:complete
MSQESKIVEKDGRWNWYGLEDQPTNSMKESMNTSEVKMMVFDSLLHIFKMGDRTAEVYKKDQNYGLRMYINKIWQKDEIIEGHTEQYAEDAAENYVFGIKK